MICRRSVQRIRKSLVKDNWEADKNTILLECSNHYNKASNQCLILVTYNYTASATKIEIQSVVVQKLVALECIRK